MWMLSEGLDAFILFFLKHPSLMEEGTCAQQVNNGVAERDWFEIVVSSTYSHEKHTALLDKQFQRVRVMSFS